MLDSGQKEYAADRYAALDSVFASGQRLMPTRVMFSDVRTR